ncbi:MULTISPECIES: histidine kinase [Streptococcus]|uniref:histidine kinase n=1 Tax=Streptococcus TaxID=1301 RepID=UPI001E324A3B|nr:MULTISPECIES: histidine kinase [unclassified Streptococcus]MDM0093456.1 histidine kinase [Streptococcus sp. VTCC 12814]MDU4508014.1 histidine kinase [Streptococcus sp.]MDU7124034.1 histidine kinase [Streptococcus sp.]
MVVVVSHLVISARLAYLDVFNYRYIPYVVVVAVVKWLAKILWQIDIPDAIYLLVFIFLEKPQASREEKYFCAFFAPVFWTLVTSFFSFYLFRVFFNKPIDLVPNNLGILAVDSVVLPFFLGLQKMFGLDRFFEKPFEGLQDKYKSMLLQVDMILIISYLLILFKQEIFSLLLSQTYLPGYPQIYIWVGLLIHMYILVRFVSYSKDVRDSEILREQEEHLRSLEAYNQKIEAAYKSVRSFKHDYENVLISMQTSIDSGDFNLIEQTYQDILKKAGQELIEEDDENAS